MRVAMCNRRVQDANDRPVYHIDKKPQMEVEDPAPRVRKRDRLMKVIKKVYRGA